MIRVCTAERRKEGRMRKAGWVVKALGLVELWAKEINK